ncbi:MAG: 30S ribosomal protein S4, partial [Acutalibacteraceae bacterium]|nr:30S ribosomal protein S4 [Acutalibacteraceae bacterium]
ICEKAKGSEKIKAVVEANSARPVPEWISVDREKLTAKVIALPTREQIDAPVEEQLIVEFYSR